MTSRGQCPRGGGGACECLHPPFQEILYPRLDRDPPPPKALPYFAHWSYVTTRSQSERHVSRIATVEGATTLNGTSETPIGQSSWKSWRDFGRQ